MNKAKTILLGGAAVAGIAAAAYFLTRPQDDVQTGENNALLGGGGEYFAGGGSTAMNNTPTSTIQDILSGIFGAQREADIAYQKSMFDMIQPSDEYADVLQTSAANSVYGDNYTAALQVYDTMTANGKTVTTTTLSGSPTTYTFGGYSSLNEAIKAGDNDAIQAYGQAAVDAAKATYGAGYDNLTTGQRSALATNISHGRTDTVDTTDFRQSASSLNALNTQDVYNAAMSKQSALTTSSTPKSAGTTGTSTPKYSSTRSTTKTGESKYHAH